MTKSVSLLVRVRRFDSLSQAPRSVFDLAVEGFHEVVVNGHCRKSIFINEEQSVFAGFIGNECAGVLVFGEFRSKRDAHIYVNLTYTKKARRGGGVFQKMHTRLLQHAEKRKCRYLEYGVHKANQLMARILAANGGYAHKGHQGGIRTWRIRVSITRAGDPA